MEELGNALACLHFQNTKILIIYDNLIENIFLVKIEC